MKRHNRAPFPRGWNIVELQVIDFASLETRKGSQFFKIPGKWNAFEGNKRLRKCQKEREKINNNLEIKERERERQKTIEKKNPKFPLQNSTSGVWRTFSWRKNFFVANVLELTRFLGSDRRPSLPVLMSTILEG